MVKIIDSFRESAMQISAVCEKQAVLFRLSWFPSSSGQEGRLSNGKGSVQLRQGMPSGSHVLSPAVKRR